jgi:VWFA-related protein
MTGRARCLRSLLTLALLAGANGRVARAQEPAERFAAAVEVRVVNVDVVVADADGNPVAGLERGDFALEVDGRAVEITNFDRGEDSAAVAGEPPPPAPVPETPATPAAPTRPAEPARLVIWIDDQGMVAAHRNRILAELAPLAAEQERRGVEVGIVRYDRGVEWLRLPAATAPGVGEALAALAKRSASGIFRESARQAALSEIESIHADSGCDNADLMANAAARYAEPLAADVAAEFTALAEFAASFAGLPGRRALLHVSDGMPLVPGQEALLLIDQLCGSTLGTRPTTGLATELRRVTAAANAAGVALYTFDAAGLAAGGGAELQGGGLDAGNAMLARANEQDPLANLASETGGAALFASNRIAPLVDRVRESFAAAYSLGFSPAGPPDGREHRIAVRVRRPGLRVRARTSYRDDRPEEQRRARLLSVLRFGGGDDELGLTIEVAASKSHGRDRATLPLRVLVPVGRLVFARDPRGETLHLEVEVAALDGEGRGAPVVRRTFDVPRAALRSSGPRAVVRVPLELEVRRERITLAIAVRDAVGGGESILRHELDVP